MCYIDKVGNYYEGDHTAGDLEVPPRPSPAHVWNGAWVLDIERFNQAINEQMKALEGGYPLARLDRELKILDLQERAAKVGITRAQLLDPADAAFSPGFAALVAYDEAVTELRRTRK